VTPEEREQALFALREALYLRVRIERMRTAHPLCAQYREAHALVDEAVRILQQQLMDDRLRSR
jgi:hypothetical protein